MRKGVTLIELIIAMSLMAVVVMGAISFDVASRRMVNSSERRSVLLNEMSLVLDYLHKDVSNAVGTLDSPAVFTGVVGPPIYQSLMIYNETAAPTPRNFSDNPIVSYQFHPDAALPGVAYTISRGADVLTRRLAGPALVAPYDQMLEVNDAGALIIRRLVLRYDPATPADNSTNPEISVSNVAIFPQATSFY